MTEKRPQRRTRKPLQFSLRALLIFVLLVSVGMSWLAVKMEKARRQKEAAEAIEKAGGVVWYEHEVAPFPRRPGPEWARALLGDDFFFKAVVARVPGDKETTHLEELTSLELVDFSNTKITDAGVARLKRLPRLEVLMLSGTQVTDVGLQHIQSITSLTWLGLHDTQVTPEGVRKLQEALPACEIVYMKPFALPRRLDW